MSSHDTPAVQRYCDVCVIGGSAAGLAAALQVVRQGWSVIVIEDREPGDGTAAGRDEVRGYGGEVPAGPAGRVSRADAGDFRVELAGGHCVIARRVLSAGPAGEFPDGAVISASLAEEGTGDAARPPANESDWDHRYAGEQMWSGNPNGTLVSEVSGLTPGRALDVGAGEGGDALWLAAEGWRVTASDVSQRALDRVSAAAGRRGLLVECHRADANAPSAYEAAAFDLVSAQYASVPRTPDDRGVRNIMNAVAPGGTLLIVGHDLEPMRAPGHGRPFDPDAYVRVDDFIAALAGSPEWDIELHEKRARPAGAASASHHVHDIVLRARRRLR